MSETSYTYKDTTPGGMKVSTRGFLCTARALYLSRGRCHDQPITFIYEDGEWLGLALCTEHLAAHKAKVAGERGSVSSGTLAFLAFLSVTSLYLWMWCFHFEVLRAAAWRIGVAVFVVVVFRLLWLLVKRLVARPPLTEHLRDLPPDLYQRLESKR